MFNLNENEKNEATIALAKNVEVPINKRGNVNTLVIGNEETDKYNSFIFPNIERCLGSYIIADYNNVIFNRTSNVLRENGYKIANIDFNANTAYNPFMYIKTDLDAQIFSNMVIKRNEIKSDDAFKEDMCELIFRVIVQYSLAMLPAEKQNLDYSVKIVQKLKENDTAYLQLIMTKIDPSASVIKYYDTIGKIPMNAYSSLLELLESKLNALGDLSAYSSTNSFNFEEIGTTKTAIFVNSNNGQNIIGIFFTQLIRKLFDFADNNMGRLNIPTFFILDNFENLGYIDNLPMHMATSRSRKIAFNIITDNVQNLSSIYTRDLPAIFGNCDLGLYLGSNNQETMEVISKTLEGNVSVSTLAELHESMCITYEKGLAPIKAVKYGKTTPSQTELKEFDEGIQNQKEQEKAKEKENRRQESLNLVKELEEKLKTETNPTNREAMLKTINVLKSVYNFDDK